MSRNVLLWRPSTDWNDDVMEGQMDGILCGDLLGGGDGKQKGIKKRPPKGKQTKDKKDSETKVKVKVKTTTTKSKTKKGGKKKGDDDDD